LTRKRLQVLELPPGATGGSSSNSSGDGGGCSGGKSRKGVGGGPGSERRGGGNGLAREDVKEAQPQIKPPPSIFGERPLSSSLSSRKSKSGSGGARPDSAAGRAARAEAEEKLRKSPYLTDPASRNSSGEEGRHL
jgi:hypothetical protein